MLELMGLSCIAGYLVLVVAPAIGSAWYAMKRTEKLSELGICAVGAAVVGGVSVARIPLELTGWATDILEGLLSLTSVLILASIGVAFLILKGASPRSAIAGSLPFAPLTAAVVWLLRVCSAFFSG